MKIYNNVSELIGNTPLMRLKKYGKDLSAEILAKIESFNPAGSVKDRVGLYMINDAEEKGLIKEGAVIIEPTSGNTGIGIAAVARARGYRVILTMPETMSIERRQLLSAYGAEIVLTKGDKGMQGAVEKAQELNREIPNSIILGQFENPSNPKAHFETTAKEIWEDTDGEIDFFVSGVGTGGTLTGVGEYLKAKNPNVKIIAVEPLSSPLLSRGKAGAHAIQGIGANFIPKTLNKDIYDEIITVSNENALKTGKEIAQAEGILVGISSGAAVWAAKQIAQREENKGKTIVALLPDSGERYLSTGMFE